jgi:hypothetical protein
MSPSPTRLVRAPEYLGQELECRVPELVYLGQELECRVPELVYLGQELECPVPVLVRLALEKERQVRVQEINGCVFSKLPT